MVIIPTEVKFGVKDYAVGPLSSRMPNLALVGKAGGCRSPQITPNLKIWSNTATLRRFFAFAVATVYNDQGEIWRRRVHHKSTAARQI